MPPNNTLHPRGPRRGFTLVELLAATAIFSVLAGLLIVGVGRVREAANGAACTAHLRQLGVASALYLADHDNILYPHRDNDYFWYDYLRPYIPQAKSGGRVRESLFCPGIFTTRPDDPRFTGFGKNGFLGKTPNGHYKRINGAYPASKVVLMWDDVQDVNWDGGWPCAGWGGGSWYKFAFRHQNHANILFLDGHIGSLAKKAGGTGNALDYPELLWGPLDDYPDSPTSAP